MTSQPISDPGRQWDFEDLLDSPRRLGLAQAHARHHGNTSARAALAHVNNALTAESMDDDDGEEQT